MRFLLFLILLSPVWAHSQSAQVPFTPAVIFNGDQVRTLRSQIDIFGAASILTGSTDPTSTAFSAPQGSIYLRTGASGGQVYAKQDSGSSTNWTQIGTGGGGGGISALTGDVTASGSGSVAASVVKIRGVSVSATAPTNNQVLTYNSTSTQWEPKANTGSGSLTATGSQTSPVTISAAGGITPTSDPRQILYAVSSSGAVSVTANPQIAAGTVVGQELILYGGSSSNYIILANGNGLSLNGPINLTDNAALFLVWGGVTWSELSRR